MGYAAGEVCREESGGCMSTITIKYGQLDPEAKADSLPASASSKPWADVSALSRELEPPGNYATLEHNCWTLDGSMKILPEDPGAEEWGFFSASMSDDNAVFAEPPELDIYFGSAHKSPGLTLYFYPHTYDRAVQVRVTWYASDQVTVLHTGEYELTGNPGVVNQTVAEWCRIKIEFLTTFLPYRYIKLYGIDYGIARTFADSDIDTASVLEEIDPISDVISVNTLNFRMKTHDPSFAPVFEDDSMLMRKQELTVTASDNPFGIFFLRTWNDVHGDGKVYDFIAQDAVGIMDGYRFMGGMYDNEPVVNILRKLFEICFPAGNIGFELDEPLANVTVSGHIPIVSCREALRQLCFAIGAVADTSRRGYVWIYRRDTETEFEIPLENKYMGGSGIEPTEYFSGVDLTSYEFSQSSEINEIHSSALAPGAYTFEFTEPLHSLTATGAAITESGANHATINVTAAGNVTLSGRRYIRSEIVHSVRGEVIAGEAANVCVFSGCALVTNENAPALAAELFAYLKQRTVAESEIRLGGVIAGLEPGYVARMESRRGNMISTITGTVERLEINLRGMRAKARIVGDAD